MEYLLAGKRFSSPVTSPFALQWHTAYAWNGAYTIQALVRDASGRELARSPETTFYIANNGSSIKLTSPSWGGAPVNGTVHVSALATLAPGRQFERFLIGLDGRYGDPLFNTSASAEIDTTTLGNGPHELTLAAFDGIASQSGLGFIRIPFNTDNGHNLQEVRANFRTVFMSPGESLPLLLRAVYSDGVEEALVSDISYSSDARAVVVDASGNLTAAAAGVAHVTASVWGHSTTVTIYVDPPRGMPHFGKGGVVLNSYDPNRSLFLRSVFFLDPQQALIQSPGLGAEAVKAGINTLTTGLYLNPVSLSGATTFPAWKAAWDSWWNDIVTAANTYGMSLFFTGDDIARTSLELNNSITGSYSAQAIQYALQTARDSGLAIAMDMVDESSFLWGDNPAPTDNRWQTRQPPIPNDAFIRLMRTMNSVSSRMPVSWPIGGTSGGTAAQNWFAPAFSDYSSHYWTLTDNRFIYPWDASVNQYRANMEQTLEQRLAVIDRTRPMIMLVTMTGNGYVKNGPGNDFTPGQDTIVINGPTPLSVGVQILYAVARGMSGVRVYAYDSVAWKGQRAAAALGGGVLETGADPFGAGQDRWNVMSNAFNLIQRLEPDFLQPQVNAVDLGPDIVTGAKAGASSRVLIAINTSEIVRTETVNFLPYLNGGASIERYRLRGADLMADSIPVSGQSRQTFEPGDAWVWVFRPNASAPPAAQPPAPPSFSPAGGSYYSPVALTINAGSGQSIYYTLDGSEPDANSMQYLAPLTISSSVTVKAKAFANGMLSPAATAVFTIAPQPPIVPPDNPPGVPAGGSGPAALWTFDDGSGASAADGSGNGNPLTLTGSPVWLSGASCKVGGCLSFDGKSQSGNVQLDLSASSTLTVAFWLSWDRFANDDSLAMEFGSAPYGFASSTGGFLIDPNSNQGGGGKFEVSLKGDAGFNQLVFARPSQGVWHHYAFVFDKTGPADSEIVPYVDGVPVPYVKLLNSNNSNGFGKGSLSIMSRFGSSLFGGGKMDDLRIYTRALALSEIQQLAGVK